MALCMYGAIPKPGGFLFWLNYIEYWTDCYGVWINPIDLRDRLLAIFGQNTTT